MASGKQEFKPIIKGTQEQRKEPLQQKYGTSLSECAELPINCIEQDRLYQVVQGGEDGVTVVIFIERNPASSHFLPLNPIEEE